MTFLPLWMSTRTSGSEMPKTRRERCIIHYNVVFMIATYFVPMVTIAIAYSIMGHVLWRSKGIGEQTERQKEAIRSKQRVVRMLVVVVMIFGVCWLPYHLYFIYTYLDPDVTYTTWAQPLYLVIYWLAMSNCMYNPFIYYWMNSRFRGYFRYVLCYCCNLGSGLGHKCSEVDRLQSDWTFNNNSPHRRTLKSTAGTECLVLTTPPNNRNATGSQQKHPHSHKNGSWQAQVHLQSQRRNQGSLLRHVAVQQTSSVDGSKLLQMQQDQQQQTLLQKQHSTIPQQPSDEH
ncbi:tachykinin-like peptides receptor 86C [Varroa jacobsoni]|uniref:tachykinin-like peptides receptor 86C n=1 Tax=Varroa jacobsoni TaxID=62625 RepID=UPI000BFA22EF|nr:tachykinin-like peptides receptor 86C [Varroa jacobsoni]